MGVFGLPKQERLHSRKLIELLFSGTGSHSMAAYPLRMVWMETERQAGDAQVQMMVSVSKRHFKHAVNRNRVKRQVREAYRQAKQPLLDQLEATPERAILVAFIWLSDELSETAVVSKRVQRLVRMLTEKL